MDNNRVDKEEFYHAIKYLKTIFNSNIVKCAKHKIAATIIGIKTNISGNFKLHIYILFFPFPKSEVTVPYSNSFPNLYFKDECLDVDESFYLWIYDMMKRKNSIVMMSLENNILKVLPINGDLLIKIDIDCIEKKEWMDLDYETWYNNKSFNNVFTINITNPFLYVVPFPVKPIVIKTVKKINNYLEILS